MAKKKKHVGQVVDGATVENNTSDVEQAHREEERGRTVLTIVGKAIQNETKIPVDWHTRYGVPTSDRKIGDRKVCTILSSYIGVVARERVNINYLKWGDVPSTTLDEVQRSESAAPFGGFVNLLLGGQGFGAPQFGTFSTQGLGGGQFGDFGGQFGNPGNQLSGLNNPGNQLSGLNNPCGQLSGFNHPGGQLSGFNNQGGQLSRFIHPGGQFSGFNGQNGGSQLPVSNQPTTEVQHIGNQPTTEVQHVETQPTTEVQQ
ncbi:hypothetical protein SOVF_030770, partial [Spinacia oleracea]